MYRPFKPPSFVRGPRADGQPRQAQPGSSVTPALKNQLRAPSSSSSFAAALHNASSSDVHRSSPSSSLEAGPTKRKRIEDASRPLNSTSDAGSDDCKVIETVKRPRSTNIELEINLDSFVDCEIVPKSSDVRQDSGRKPLAPSEPLKSKVAGFRPLEPSSRANAISGQDSTNKDTEPAYFSALWRKPSNRKNKGWDGDGTLILQGMTCTLQDSTGRVMGKTRSSLDALVEQAIFRIGSMEAKADGRLSSHDALSARSFYGSQRPVSLKRINADDFYDDDIQVINVTAPVTSAFKSPFMKDPRIMAALERKLGEPVPCHDPGKAGALVMPDPKETNGRKLVSVVVDPHLSNCLRPHQREGVTFLYECVMGLKDIQGNGALLADEMGLGKTLTTITLIWTLLKQTPWYGEKPIAKKVLIVCPATLISNWKREFRKWLGRERISVFAVDSKANLKDFTKGRVYQVMIIGYEKLRLVQSELQDVTFDLVICDEGHRIKSTNNKSAQALKSMQTTRRVLLTGTPIQNDLGEFFAMVEFINPGLFQSYSMFKKEFEVPIIKSRQPEARKKDIELGKVRSEQLSNITKQFVLRRTTDILAQFLPPKNEFVVFCKPSQSQLEISKDLLGSAAMKSLIGSNDSSNHLRAITLLKKVCSSPKLLLNSPEGENRLTESIDKDKARMSTSGKLMFLECFLRHLRRETNEKVVLVSSYTQTLDLLQTIMARIPATYLRLDGSTPTKKRQELVDTFNYENSKQSFAFLLSAKSGGAGINLIGASRLILFDTDWNPSVDLQAMARIHRDGQKKPVFIYRLLTTGCMDEKIYQRQLTKIGLADNLVDGKASSSENSFTATELRDIFTIHTDTLSHTHDLLECKCDGTGTMEEHNEHVKIEKTEDDESDLGSDEEGGWVSASQLVQGKLAVPARLQSKNRLKALMEFSHINPARVVRKHVDLEDASEVLHDAVLQKAFATDEEMACVSFVFRRMLKHVTPIDLTGEDGGKDNVDVEDDSSDLEEL
ncbi:SNF2 family N-terminal domain-containing protein [Limtongia smithiae]|uniref:SNF2 family N-terminal domain-containing protein n=1 Tax=Limtongia smithiae TaxID=1125753 RepID=UPI0034CE2FCC